MISLCNTLPRFIADPLHGDFVATAAELAARLAHHFICEEELLLSTGFERLHVHRREHQKISAQMEDLCELARCAATADERLTTACAVRELLIETVVRHDLDFKSHLQFTAGRRSRARMLASTELNASRVQEATAHKPPDDDDALPQRRAKATTR